MQTKDSEERMEKETKEQIWKKLESFAEKKVRENKEGYLELALIKERSYSAISQEDWEKVDLAIQQEKKKGYSEEDLRFFWKKGTGMTSCFSRPSLVFENRVSNAIMDCFPTEAGHKEGIICDIIADSKSLPKSLIVKAKEIERQFKEEEQKARQHLKHELEAKDSEIERLKNTINSLHEELQEKEENEEKDE